MTDLQRKNALLVTFVNAGINLMVGFGVIPLNATGTALLNTAASGLAAFILYLVVPSDG